MNGLIVFLLLLGFACGVVFGYRVLNENAFISSKYNLTLTRAILASALISTILAALLAIVETLG